MQELMLKIKLVSLGAKRMAKSHKWGQQQQSGHRIFYSFI